MSDAEHSEHSAPSAKQYVAIAVILAIITVAEVASVELLPASMKHLTVPILLSMTVAKALLVTLYYMHLKFDSRLFSYMFAGAIFVFGVPMGIVFMVLFQFISIS